MSRNGPTFALWGGLDLNNMLVHFPRKVQISGCHDCQGHPYRPVALAIEVVDFK
jgi:hypothetical protein